MLFPFNEIKTMGVINITPNSFSDTTSMLLDQDVLKQTINQSKKIPGIIFDFGFESTAPMNSAISKLQERERFDIFFENIADVDLDGRWISFDTYRPENFRYFEEKFKSRYSNCGFIFNDVSGVIDEDLIELLKTKRQQSDFYYIYTSTHIPSRDNVLNHMQYLSIGEDIVSESSRHFSEGLKKFKEIGILNKIILDPGFGFSKSYDQNWDLINRFDELVDDLELDSKKVGRDFTWLIGISKKSFLRKSLVDSSDPFRDSEILHAQIIKGLIEKKLGHLIFRVHDPFLVESL